MKTLIASALVAAAAFAAPATAQVGSGTAAAIAHFNQSHDTQDNRIALRGGVSNTFVSTRSASSDRAYAIFNAQADNVNALRGLYGQAGVSGTPAYGAEIFARIQAESLEGE
ncbi:hypothetical protein [uncultured Jannaschia sp.]|uniref:hypothetical protein n=1 Tax=uncultured Jannaschia sp. TaxID=293347 RepID=UPI0026025920|nr:hypothetical protein [uncultured Jannaschia sp.]